jgi:hypothetical protein
MKCAGIAGDGSQETPTVTMDKGRPMKNYTLEMIGRNEPFIFRGDEEIMHGATASVDFYENVIAQYKGSLEEWFVSNKSLYIYFLAFFVTAWAVLIPSTKIAWRAFKDLPEPPTELKQVWKL